MADEPNVAKMSIEELVEAYNTSDKPNVYGQELIRRLVPLIQSGKGWK